MDEKLELRPRQECEEQLAAELAVGAVDSIDSLIERGHETACEYACQLLFDNLRERVARQKNLPVRIVNHLLNDRCASVRWAVIQNNWGALTPERQEQIIQEAERAFSNPKREKYPYRGDPEYELKMIIKPLLKMAIGDKDEKKALRYASIIGIREVNDDSEDFVDALKEMPEFFRLYWADHGIYGSRADLILAHPDEEERMKVLQKIMDKNTRPRSLDGWREALSTKGTGKHIKTEVLKKFALDPSPAIRLQIAKNSTNPEVLAMLIYDSDNEVARVAQPRAIKFTKRAAYSKAYHEKRIEKGLT